MEKYPQYAAALKSSTTW